MRTSKDIVVRKVTKITPKTRTSTKNTLLIIRLNPIGWVANHCMHNDHNVPSRHVGAGCSHNGQDSYYEVARLGRQ